MIVGIRAKVVQVATGRELRRVTIPADDESPMARRSYSKAKGVYWQTLAFLAEQRDLLNNLLGRQG